MDISCILIHLIFTIRVRRRRHPLLRIPLHRPPLRLASVPFIAVAVLLVDLMVLVVLLDFITLLLTSEGLLLLLLLLLLMDCLHRHLHIYHLLMS